MAQEAVSIQEQTAAVSLALPGQVETSAVSSEEEEAAALLREALHEVEDPEFPMSIVDMGLVVDVKKVGRTAQIKLTFTAMGCPCMDMIMEDTRNRLLQEPDIDQVELEVVWSPVWTRQRLSERGREIMQLYGVTV